MTCTLPSGTELHVGVYDITERHHMEIQRRRNDFESLLAYLSDNICSSARITSSPASPDRALWTISRFSRRAFPAIETRNGHMMPRAATGARGGLARPRGEKAEMGGSDAHAMATVGRAWTEVPGARDAAEFLAGLRAGIGRPQGESGGW